MATADGIELRGPIEGRFAEILTPAALAFVAELQRELGAPRAALLRRRAERQAAFDAGGRLDFLPETREIRAGAWTVAPAPKDLERRWVELTGPAERKMVINALNSGADVFMADFEDANTPTWRNMVQGQVNLLDAVSRTIEHRNPDGRIYRLHEVVATLLVRPRGWHLSERHVPGGRGRRVGEPVRLRALRLPQRPPAPRARERALLLPPEARGPPRGAALERRVRPGRGPARSPAGRDPRHRPRRDPPGRVRDGRDPVGAARPLGRAQRRPLGLHVQPHQEAPGPARVRPAGPGAGHDDGAVHAGLHRAPREDLSPPRRARARRNGGLHPEPARSAGQRGGPGPGAGGQDPRVPGRLRRDVGRPPGPRRGRPRAVRAPPR